METKYFRDLRDNEVDWDMLYEIERDRRAMEQYEKLEEIKEIGNEIKNVIKESGFGGILE